MTAAPWTFALPGSWSVQPLIATTHETARSNFGMAEDNLLSLSYGRIVPKDIAGVDGLLPESFETYQVVERGQVVCRFTDLQNDKRSLRTGLVRERGIITSAYVALATRMEPRWLAYLLRSYDTQKVFYGLGGGLRQSIKYSDIKRLPLISPPGEVQRRIADFLDRETAKIDALIAKQRRLASLLRTRHLALIRLLLLRGPDAEAPTSDSGTEFIGRIPVHWHVVPTRYLCDVTTGSRDSGDATSDGKYPFYIRGREVLRIDSFGFDCEAVLTPGDGQGGTGKVFHYADGRFEAHQRVYVFKDFVGVLGRYYYYWLSTFLEPIALAGTKTVTMESLRRPLLVGLPVAVPPLDEQRDILRRLEREGAHYEKLMAKADMLTTALEERRAALITAAVTAEIDVATYSKGG